MRVINTNLSTNIIKLINSSPVIIFVIIFSAIFLTAPVFAAGGKEIKNDVKSEKKESKKNNVVKNSKNTVIQDSDDEIIAAEDDELEIEGDEQISENKKIVNPKNNKAAKDKNSNSKAESGALKSEKTLTGGEKKKTEFSFNYTAESRIDKINRDRMKGKVFLEKISNDYFKIYADEDDFIVIADFPYGKENTTHTLKFVDEHKLVITFKNKINNALAPVRYEISFPEATKKEVFDFSVRDKLELIVPIDFFYAERKNFR